MNFFSLKTLAILLLPLFLFSCYSIPVNEKDSRSWRMPEEKRIKGTVKIINVTADRSGGRDSLEKETAVLAPLYFWKKGFRTVALGEYADYAAEINLREREFSAGWRTKRSLTVEVRIWKCVDGDLQPEDAAGKLPIAAGRIVLTGNKSFSSSKVAGKLLSDAVSKTVKRLPSQYRLGMAYSERVHSEGAGVQ